MEVMLSDFIQSPALYLNEVLNSVITIIDNERPIAVLTKFVKMYNDRIIDGVIDFSEYHGAIFCPNCNERIATRYITKMDKKEAYRLVPSAFHKKKV